MSLLAQASDAALADPGFQQWVMYAIAALLLWERLSKVLGQRAERREVSGRIETTTTKEPADKSEVEDELRDILAKVEELKSTLHEVVKEITAAGQKRADTISRKIDEVERSIRADVESRLSLIHEKVNAAGMLTARHSEAIEHLKARDFQHDQSLAALQQRTASGRKPS